MTDRPPSAPDLIDELEANPTQWPPADFLDEHDCLTTREKAALWLQFEIGLDQAQIGALLQPPTNQQGASRLLKSALQKMRSSLETGSGAPAAKTQTAR